MEYPYFGIVFSICSMVFGVGGGRV
jgi:hypothetical protein